MNTMRRTRNAEAGTPELQTGGGQTRVREPRSEPAKRAGRALLSRHFAIVRPGVRLLPSVSQCLRFSRRCGLLSATWLLSSALLHGQSPAADELYAILGGAPEVHALAVQADGSILLGGWFTAIGEQPRANLARLSADGTLDLNFHPWANEMVHCFAMQSDGMIVVGGAFSQLGGWTRNGLARLNADGTPDSGFSASLGASGYAGCYALAVQPDGKLIVGGYFNTLGGQPHNNLGRLEADGTVDFGFQADADGEVKSLAILPDEKILVGGYFTELCGQPRTNLARLNSDGTLDAGFDSGPIGSVYALAIQPDGKIVVGGSFTTAGGQPRNSIARLNADGSLDGGFNPGVGGISPYSYVYSLALQADGRILVSGYFTTVAGQSRYYLARLNADGTLDSGFNPSANGVVDALAIQADGKVLVGGAFSFLGGRTRYSLGRLNATEPATQSLTFDATTITWLRGGTSPEVWRTSFDHSPDGLMWTSLGEGARIPGGWRLSGVLVPSGGRLRAQGWVSGGYGSGSAWFVEAYAGEPVLVAEPLSRTNDAGTTATFSVVVRGSEPISYQWFKDNAPLGDERNVAGANTPTLTLTNVLGGDTGAYHIVVSNSLGSVTSATATLTVLDPVIIAQPASEARELGQSVTFSVTAVGTAPLDYQWWKDDAPLSAANEASLTLTNLQAGDAGAYRVVVSNSLGSVTSMDVRLTVNVITLETNFNPMVNGSVFAQALQPDGKILLGGDFTTLGGQPRNRIGRLNADGTLDAGFNPGASGTVFSIAVQADGRILLAGGFTSLAGQTRNHLARLQVNGTVDEEFNPGTDGDVTCLALQADGMILVGGCFSTLNGQSRRNLARLNADGTLDSALSQGADNCVASFAVQPDGKILVGGFFTTLNGQGRNRIGRLNANGTPDYSFNPGADAGVTALALQADGKILVGGYFTRLGGQVRTNLARLNPNGTLDGTFNPHAGTLYEGDYPTVYSLAVQADGMILVGGSFSTIAGEQRYYLARLHADGSLDKTFNPTMGSAVYGLALQPDGRILAAGSAAMPGGQWRENLVRLNNSAPATQGLVVDGSTINWLREGTGPEVWRTTFEHSPDGLVWTALGEGTRVPDGWQLTDVVLPSGGTLRARGYVTGGQCNGSSWFAEVSRGQPIFVASSDSRTNNAGTTATFSVAPGGSEPFSFRWLKDGIPLADDANVLGTSSATLTLSNVFKADEGGYAVVVSNSFGSAISTVARLTVVDPVITVQPGSQMRQLGESATFTVTAVGTAPLQSQWWKNDSPLPGGTNASLTLTNLHARDVGNYHAVVSNSCGSVTSAVAFLSVNLATLDTTFLPTADRTVNALAMQPDGKILVGGTFTRMGGQYRTNLARLNADGSLDAGFATISGAGPRAVSTMVNALSIQADGKILVGGRFTRMSGQARTNLARLDADGTLDSGFATGLAGSKASAQVNVLAIEADGRILVGGDFTMIGGQQRTNLARLNVDGTVDGGFNPGPRMSGGSFWLNSSAVQSLAVQPDGKILLGGSFTTLAGQPRSNLGRLNPDGSLDVAFNPGANSNVLALVLQADGKILVGGSFTKIGGQSCTNLARLDPDGSLDGSFTPGIGGATGGFRSRSTSVSALAVQTDGMILVGGSFTKTGGQARTNLARLFADGTVDGGFNPGPSGGVNATLNSIALQSNGAVLLGGYFSTLAGVPRLNLARINATGPASQCFSFYGSTITWRRGGTGPEVWRTAFETSSDGVSWTELGTVQRIPGGWQLTDVTLHAGNTIRARGFIAGSGVGEGIVGTTLRLIPGICTCDGAFGVLSNQFGFHLSGLPDQVVVLEGSTDLLHWSPLQTNTLGSSLLYFSEPWSVQTPHRFYRARLWP